MTNPAPTPIYWTLMRDEGAGFDICGVVMETAKMILYRDYFCSREVSSYTAYNYKDKALGRYSTLEAARSAREMALAIIAKYDEREDPLLEQMRIIGRERDAELARHFAGDDKTTRES